MKRLLMFGLASVFVLGSTGKCLADPYVTGNLGAVIGHDSDWIDSTGTIAEVTSDTGYALSLAFGNALDDVRFEAELAYRSNDLDEMTIFTVPSVSGSINGEVSSIALMGNIFKDFDNNTVVSPFVGLGIGVANVEGELSGFGNEDDTVFAYQLALGLAARISETTKIDLSYRYFTTTDLDLGGTDVEYETSNFMVGLRISF